jgi:hypothetical protein
MLIEELKASVVVRGPIFPEPVQVIVVVPMGSSVKLIGKGLHSNTVHEPILSAEQLALLSAVGHLSLETRRYGQTLNSDASRAFDRSKSGRIAVKVINQLGDEVMKVFKV